MKFYVENLIASKMVSGWKMIGKLEWGPAADLPVWGGVRSARTLVRIVLDEYTYTPSGHPPGWRGGFNG